MVVFMLRVVFMLHQQTHVLLMYQLKNLPGKKTFVVRWQEWLKLVNFLNVVVFHVVL
jgi:hypothetical protein